MQLSLTTSAPSTALTWANKKGATLTAHSDTAQAFAPKAARLTHAHALTLAALGNGQYRPFLKDCAEALSKADAKALERLGFDTMPSNKAGMLHFMRAIVALWASAKGKRAALAAVAADWLNAANPSEPVSFPALDGVPADTAPADTADTPLPVIEPALI